MDVTQRPQIALWYDDRYFNTSATIYIFLYSLSACFKFFNSSFSV